MDAKAAKQEAEHAARMARLELEAVTRGIEAQGKPPVSKVWPPTVAGIMHTARRARAMLDRLDVALTALADLEPPRPGNTPPAPLRLTTDQDTPPCQ